MSSISGNSPQFDFRFGASQRQTRAQAQAGDDVTSSPKDFPPGCLTGGASEVTSEPIGGCWGTHSVTSSPKDFPPGCLTGGATEVTSEPIGGCWGTHRVMA